MGGEPEMSDECIGGYYECEKCGRTVSGEVHICPAEINKPKMKMPTDDELNLVMCEWIGVDLQDPYWFCDRCQIELPWQQVTNDELHDIDSCRTSVRWVEPQPPDYLNDLNAMHDAENAMREKCKASGDWQQWTQYVMTLCEMNAGHYGGALNAKARQRAEAFLRTLNLWKD